MRGKESRVVSFNLDVDIIERLSNFCEKERRTKTSAVELAITEYLDNHFKDEDKEGGER